MSKTSKAIPTRDRILTAARRLFQQRGYHAIGTAEILKIARAPKGSMYHHFPGGKEEIAVEAIKRIRRDVVTALRKLESDRNTVPDILRIMAKNMARWLKASRWREGTLLASTTVGAVPDLPKVHTAIREALDEWRDQFATLLIRERWRKTDARRFADVIVAAMEGAMIVARVDQDESVVVSVAESLARSIER